MLHVKGGIIMDSFIKMLNTQLILVIYIGIGLFCSKKQIIDSHTKQKLTDLILNITLPCMTFASFNKELTADVIHDAELCFLVALCITVLSFTCGKLLYNRFPKDKRSILQYTTLVNNSGFLGMPMVSSVFGDDGLYFASIFIIPNRIAMWTAGISLFTHSSLKESAKKIFLNPCIIAVILGLIRQFAGISLPGFMDTAISDIGDITTPLSMFIIGTMLVDLKLSSMVEPAILWLTFIRLIALPLIALCILRAIGASQMLTGISMILTGMPAGSTSVLLSVKYGLDADFASRCVVTTTLISLITVPLMMLLI